MPCGSAHLYESDLVGSTVSQQVDNSIHGVLAPVSPQYQMQMHQGSMAGQVGGKGRRTRKHMRRRSTKHKKRTHRKKSRKMIRRRK
jgi:hypothetical protein